VHYSATFKKMQHEGLFEIFNQGGYAMKQKRVRKLYLREFKAISHAISTYEDLNLLINHLVEGTNETFNAKGCSILLLDQRENQLFHIASYGISEEYRRKGPIFVVSETQCAICTGEPVFVEDVQKDPRVQYPEAAAKEGIVSMASIPIKSRNATIGVLRIYHAEPCTFHKDDVDALCVLTEHLGLAIENNGLKNFLDMVKTAMGSLPLRMLDGL
jgi:signal transduction protein with GAF and PtsI domain